jgi:hypothetical protein
MKLYYAFSNCQNFLKMGRSHSKVKSSEESNETAINFRDKIKSLKRQYVKKTNTLEKFRIKSKSKKKLEKPTPASSTTTRRKPVLTELDYDAEAKRRMQEQLAFNSDIFVLNQMMLSVQFFRNFERYGIFECIQVKWRFL